MSLKSTLTFKVVFVIAIVWLLQAIPYTGIILMIFGAPIWLGAAFHFIPLALCADIIRFNVSKAMLIIPLFPYVLYYANYVEDLRRVPALERSIRAQNPQGIVRYNSEAHSLVLDHNVYGDFLEQYKLPVVYRPVTDSPEGYFGYRMATQEICQKIKDEPAFKEEVAVSPVRWRTKIAYRKHYFKNVCILRMPEAPAKESLTLSSREEKDPLQPHLHKRAYEFSLGGRPLGIYKTATYNALPAFPMISTGCALISSTPAWKCFFKLMRDHRVVLNVAPPGMFGKEGQHPIMRLLRIPAYEQREIEQFEDLPETRTHFEKLLAEQQQLDAWGNRPSSPYHPQIDVWYGHPSFKGFVSDRSGGGYFYDFISAHTGRIVYLDIQVMRGVSRTGYFALDGVCRPKKPECNDRTTRIYRFKTEQGKNYWFEEAGVYKGFFKVGTESPSKGKQNQADFDTTRDLIVTPDFAE